MKAFDVAWSLLKEEARFSANQIKELAEKIKQEKETGTYSTMRGATPLENLMGIHPLRQQYFDYYDKAKKRFNKLGTIPIPAAQKDRDFVEGLESRMNLKPHTTPTRVVHGKGYGDKFELQDDEGNVYSTLSGQMVQPEHMDYSTPNPTLTYLQGETTPGERRKGYYEKLLNTILQNNINIHSTARNSKSGPFHQKFQGRLPPNIDFKEKKGNFMYMKNPILDSKQQALRQAQGWGDLQPDYNVAPMVQEKDNLRFELDDLTRQHQGTEQLKLNDRGFLASSNPQNPMHNIHEMMFRTPSGKPYSTQHVLMDKYNPDYEDHPFFEGLGHLFA